jgi:uncharacterized metal-binding protein YceD (DUF177 family)
MEFGIGDQRMKPHIDFDQVDQYGPQHHRAAVSLAPELLEREEVKSALEVSLDLTASKGEMDGEYLVDGTVQYQGELHCARCLEPFPFASTAEFALRYRPRPDDFGSPEAEIELADKELDLDYYEDRSVPLETIAFEQVQLSLPMKPLCEEACQGLCPNCGANLRRGGCDCAVTTVDQRWDSLREFREQLARKKEN